MCVCEAFKLRSPCRGSRRNVYYIVCKRDSLLIKASGDCICKGMQVRAAAKGEGFKARRQLLQSAECLTPVSLKLQHISQSCCQNCKCKCFQFPCCSFWPFLNKVYDKSQRITIEHRVCDSLALSLRTLGFKYLSLCPS